MSTYQERRVDILNKRLRSRTRADGSPLPGYKQNVASIRAELESLSDAEERVRTNG